MRIIGVDIGSKTLALALLSLEADGELAYLASVSIKPKEHWVIERRLRYMDSEIRELLVAQYKRLWRAEAMAVEEPWGGPQKAFRALWRTVGHCECIANRLGMDFGLVRVCDWRKTSGLKPKKRKDLKDEAVKMVEVLFREKGKRPLILPEDEAEAVLIARHYVLTMR